MADYILYMSEVLSMPGDAICSEARLKYWEEEWLSQLLSEALRLKGSTPDEEAVKAKKKAET